jgi:hypothetical protein
MLVHVSDVTIKFSSCWYIISELVLYKLQLILHASNTIKIRLCFSFFSLVKKELFSCMCTWERGRGLQLNFLAFIPDWFTWFESVWALLFGWVSYMCSSFWLVTSVIRALQCMSPSLIGPIFAWPRDYFLRWLIQRIYIVPPTSEWAV